MLTLLLITPLQATTQNDARKAELLVNNCYHHTDLTPVQKASIQDLIVHLEGFDLFEQAQIATETQAALHKVTHSLKQQQLKAKTTSEQNYLAFQLMLATIQEKHLERFAALTLNKIPGYKKAFNASKLWVNSTFGTKSNHLNSTIAELIAYTKLERENLLTTPAAITSFFHAQDNNALPQIMRFWWFRPEQHKIIKASKHITTNLMPCAAALVDIGTDAGEVAAETVEQVGATGEEVGVAGEDAASVTADASEVAQLEKDTAPLVNESQAVEQTTETGVATATKAVNEADPLAELGLSAKSSLTPEIEQSLTELSTELQTVTDTTNNAIQEALAKTSAKLNAAKGATAWIKARYADGLVGTTEKVLSNSADWVQNGLVKLSTKYPDSGALQLATDGFKSSRSLFGAIYKYSPLGLIKWMESSPTGKVLYDMLKLSLVMSGSSMYNSWINQQTFAAWTKLSTFKTQLATAMQTMLTNIQAAFSVKDAQLVTQFQTTIAQMSTNQTAIQSQNAQELAYLNNALTQTTMQQFYMSTPMYNDQLFALSGMLTPQAPSSTAPTQTIPQTLSFSNQAAGSWAGPIVVEKKNLALGATGQAATVPTITPPQTTIEQVISALPNQTPVYAPWHNIFRRGNWEYIVNKTDAGDYQGAFVQQTVVPLDATPTATTPIFLQALYNSIFTQYIPPAFYYKGTETHIIQIECTLKKVSYPFFMGLYFNGGRWISGIDQLRYQRRTVGVLGSAPGQSAIWFGETFYLQPQNALKQQVNAIWPLWQFFRASTGDAAVWQQQNPNAFIATKPLYNDPINSSAKPLITPGVTLIFTIATQPTQVIISVQLQGSEEPLLDNVVIPNLNSKTFMYHNIGFIAAGCAASYTLKHPQSLTYDTASLSAFLSEVS